LAKQRRGLGKGLEALIPQRIEEDIFSDRANKGIVTIDIDKIIPNRDQPRKTFDKEKLENLEKSIELHGIVQPIIVRKVPEGYEIVAGERRWRAAKNVGLKEIPCIVKELEEDKVIEFALIENLQREDLNDIEEALAYKKLIEEHSLTQERISIITGKSRSYIANTLRLLNLTGEVQRMIIEGKITGGHGKALLKIEDEKLQLEVANRVIKDELSVRETERLVNKIAEGNKKRKRESRKDSHILYIEEILKETLGTKVSIVKGKKKGKIEIEYYSDDDLDRIINILRDNVSRETL